MPAHKPPLLQGMNGPARGGADAGEPAAADLGATPRTGVGGGEGGAEVVAVSAGVTAATEAGAAMDAEAVTEAGTALDAEASTDGGKSRTGGPGAAVGG
jgi:hypothetical protein